MSLGSIAAVATFRLVRWLGFARPILRWRWKHRGLWFRTFGEDRVWQIGPVLVIFRGAARRRSER